MNDDIFYPRIGDNAFYVSPNGEIVKYSEYCCPNPFTLGLIAMSNCFKSYEIALANKDKALAAMTKIDEQYSPRLYGKKYYYITNDVYHSNNLGVSYFYNTATDLAHYNMGNCFLTKEAAEEHREEIRAKFAALEKEVL